MERVLAGRMEAGRRASGVVRDEVQQLGARCPQFWSWGLRLCESGELGRRGMFRLMVPRVLTSPASDPGLAPLALFSLPAAHQQSEIRLTQDTVNNTSRRPVSSVRYLFASPSQSPSLIIRPPQIAFLGPLSVSAAEARSPHASRHRINTPPRPGPPHTTSNSLTPPPGSVSSSIITVPSYRLSSVLFIVSSIHPFNFG